MGEIVSIQAAVVRIWRLVSQPAPLLLLQLPPLPLRLPRRLLCFQLQRPLLLRLALKPQVRLGKLPDRSLQLRVRFGKLRLGGGEGRRVYVPACLFARFFSARFCSAGRTASHFWR